MPRSARHRITIHNMDSIYSPSIPRLLYAHIEYILMSIEKSERALGLCLIDMHQH